MHDEEKPSKTHYGIAKAAVDLARAEASAEAENEVTFLRKQLFEEAKRQDAERERNDKSRDRMIRYQWVVMGLLLAAVLGLAGLKVYGSWSADGGVQGGIESAEEAPAEDEVAPEE